jgi:hypothetical protein
MRKIPIPPEITEALDALEREITGSVGIARPIVIERGLPDGPHVATVRYPGGMVWVRTAEANEIWSDFLKRIAIDAEARGGRIIAVGGLPPEPRDDVDPSWKRVGPSGD